MMKRCVATIALVLLAGAAWCGDDGYSNGYYPQNQYQTYGSTGTQQTYGYSPSTGNSWSSQSHGRQQSGINSQGQSWSYDRGTGVYQNYGTGEIRFNQPQPRQKAW